MRKINEAIIFQPTKSTIANHDRLCKNEYMKSVFIKSGKETISGILYNKNKIPSWDDNNIIIFSHGNAGNIEFLPNSTIINMLSEYDTTIFMYDYRGYGISTGKSTEESAYEDIKNVWNYVTIDQNVKPENIILYAHSLGCAITSSLLVDICQNNNDSLPKAVILEAPFVNIRTIAKKMFGCLAMFCTVSKFDNLQNLKIINNQLPIYIFHSKTDEVIPYDHGVELAKSIDCIFIDIKGSHNYSLYTKESKNVLMSLVKK